LADNQYYVVSLIMKKNKVNHNIIKGLKEKDKFYTRPEIAKKFVDKINQISSLSSYDLVLEPAAGSGNILEYLPLENTLGMDLYPDSDIIIKKDFFDYYPTNFPLHMQRIACVTNPPFGKGYMNPLAKKFFNHAAQFCDLIAFIVPSKWHSSWKVHKQLNSNFGLYFSEILPKDSFVLNGESYNVNCCMQIWSKSSLGKNMRILKAPKTKHEDFDLFLTCDNVPRKKQAMEQLSNGTYWEFGLKYWGKIGIQEIKDIPKNTTTHFLFHCHKPYVRKIIEQIDWTPYILNMGAPNIGGKSILIQAYDDKKKELNIVD
jgi:hypothetical protein